MDAIRWLLSDVRIPNKPRETRKRLYVIGRRKGYSTATIDGLRWKLEALLNKGIIGAGFDISDVIKPGYLTVVDLSTVDQSLRSLVVAAMLSKITEARKRNAIRPLLVVIEEAHNYVPPEETPSSVMIRDLIRGARHWGIGIMLVSQRPSGIHRDTINVANTHIIFRLKGTDLEYVKQFAPFTKEELEDVQILPDGVAYITGPIIRGGLSIKVATRKRRTVHGGQSIKFLDT
jgi:DNA helicase HerA-like ATPase